MVLVILYIYIHFINKIKKKGYLNDKGGWFSQCNELNLLSKALALEVE